MGFKILCQVGELDFFSFDAELAADDYRSRKIIAAGGLQSGGTNRS